MYDEDLVRAKLEDLKQRRLQGDVDEIVFALRTDLLRNLGNMCNPELHKGRLQVNERDCSMLLKSCHVTPSSFQTELEGQPSMSLSWVLSHIAQKMAWKDTSCWDRVVAIEARSNCV